MYRISKELAFPDVELANEDPNGLLAIGGDLEINRLIFAYQNGIFPWYSSGEPILWWSPNPRSILLPRNLKISRSLRKTIRNGGFSITFDRCFTQIMQACAAPRDGDPRTWINTDMLTAYTALHHNGYAHSVECWQNNKLVGGLYGVAIDRVFFGESMFTRVSNASKVAFVFLVKQLEKWGFALIDCQMQTAHLDSLGAINILRTEFIALLKTNCCDITPNFLWDSDIVIDRIVD